MRRRRKEKEEQTWSVLPQVDLLEHCVEPKGRGVHSTRDCPVNITAREMKESSREGTTPPPPQQQQQQEPLNFGQFDSPKIQAFILTVQQQQQLKPTVKWGQVTRNASSPRNACAARSPSAQEQRRVRPFSVRPRTPQEVGSLHAP